MLSKIKNLIGAVLVAGALHGEAKAQDAKEHPVTVSINTAVQKEKELNSQISVGYGKDKVYFEQTKTSQNYGLNLEHKGFRLNTGLKDAEKDKFRTSLSYKTDKGFFGLEYQLLKDEEKEHIGGAFGGIKLCECADLEAAVDTEENYRGALFLRQDKTFLFGIGGGIGREDKWELDLAFDKRFFEKIKFSPYARVGSDDLFEARLKLGTKTGIGAGIIGVEDTFYNNTSKVGQVDFPFFIGPFDILGAETFVGNETLDFGFDARYFRNKRAYANLAVNLGDYLFFEDVTASIKGHKNLATKVDGSTAKLGAKIPKIGLKLDYQADLKEHSRPEHAVLIGFRKEF